MNAAEKLLLSLIGTALEVRRDGAIWRIAQRGRTGRWRPIEPTRADELRDDAYRRVRVQLDGRTASGLAHRIVWQWFMGPIPEGVEVNHKNGDRGDNRLGNLELLTKGENLEHAYRELGRFRASGERNGRAVLTADQVATIRERLAAGKSHRSIARDFGVSHVAVGKIARRETWRDQFPEAVHV